MMTVNDIKRLVIFFSLISLAIHILIFLILFLPRDYTRNVRRFIAEMIKFQWVAGSRISQIAHQLFWQEGNGS